MTLIGEQPRHRHRLVDRVAARAVALSIDPALTADDVSPAIRQLCADPDVLAVAARRLELDLLDRPCGVTQRAVEALRCAALQRPA